MLDQEIFIDRKDKKMRIFEVCVLEKSTGKFNISLLDTKRVDEPRIDLVTDLGPEEAERLIDDLNLVLKHNFNDYEPIL